MQRRLVAMVAPGDRQFPLGVRIQEFRRTGVAGKRLARIEVECHNALLLGVYLRGIRSGIPVGSLFKEKK